MWKVSANAVFLPFWGVWFVLRHWSRVRRYVVPPIVLMLVLIFAGLWFVFVGADDLLSWVWSFSSTEVWWLSGLRGVAEWLLRAVLSVFVILVAYGLGSVLASPFNDALSEYVESVLLQLEPTKQSVGQVLLSAWGSIGVETTKFVAYVLLLGGSFIFSLATVWGTVAYPFSSFMLFAAYVGLDCVDFPAARRFPTMSKRWEWFRKNWIPVFLFGVTAAFLLWVPGLNLLLLPGAVAGGTRLFTELDNSALNIPNRSASEL